jgi:hypothetical protein
VEGAAALRLGRGGGPVDDPQSRVSLNGEGRQGLLHRLLEHQYTPDGFSFDGLKAADDAHPSDAVERWTPRFFV